MRECFSPPLDVLARGKAGVGRVEEGPVQVGREENEREERWKREGGSVRGRGVLSASMVERRGRDRMKASHERERNGEGGRAGGRESNRETERQRESESEKKKAWDNSAR